MQYDSFYFLHIPKTDGRRFIDLILLDLKDNNPQLKFPAGNLMGNYFGDPYNAHQGWIPEITDKTYVFSMMRDPIKRAVSYYVFLIMQQIKQHQDFKTYTSINFTKEGFIKYVESQKDVRNVSSKMFLYNIDSDMDRRYLFQDLSLKDKNEIDILMTRVKRSNLLLKSETFASMDKQDLFRKISQDLGIDERPVSIKKADFEPTYTKKESSLLYDLLTDSDKQYLRQYFDVDYYIYKKEDLFWNP